MKKTKTRRFTKRRSSLFLVAFLLLASAGLRVSEHGDLLSAFAAGGAMPSAEDNEMHAEKDEMSEDPASVDMLLRELAAVKARKKDLDSRQAAVEEREALLKLAEMKIQENLQALVAAEESLKATMALSATAAEDDLTRLTAVYENMKPKEAAVLFEEMSPEFAAGFLARMRPDSAAQIMAGLESTTAYSVSVIMAGRNADAPTE